MRPEMDARLAQVLEARDLRWRKLAGYCRLYQGCIVVATMNIPGPEKNNTVVSHAFGRMLQDLERETGSSLLCLEQDSPPGGPYAFFLDREGRDAEGLKRVLVEFELRHPVGRWIDLDVRKSDLSAVSRVQLGFPERRCILCDHPAKECARSRRHPVEELYQATMRALEAYAGM